MIISQLDTDDRCHQFTCKSDHMDEDSPIMMAEENIDRRRYSFLGHARVLQSCFVGDETSDICEVAGCVPDDIHVQRL